MPFTQGLCENIQQSLIDVAGNNAPSLRRDKAGLVEALLSAENTSGVDAIQLDQGNGKIRNVQLSYIQRGLESDVTTAIDNDCASGVETEPIEKIVSITNELQTKIKFSEEEIRKICDGQAQWTADVINSKMNAMLVKLNKELLTQVAAGVGTFVGGAATKQIQLFNTSTTNEQSARRLALGVIREDMAQAGFSDAPMLIGAGELAHFAHDIGLTDMTSLRADASRSASDLASFYYDRFVDPALVPVINPANSDFLAIIPKSAFLLTWNRYVGEHAKRSEHFEHGTITDPMSGITFDLKSHYDDCADEWYVKLQLNWEMCKTPSDAFAATDDLFGVNGCFHYEICDAVANC